MSNARRRATFIHEEEDDGELDAGGNLEAAAAAAAEMDEHREMLTSGVLDTRRRATTFSMSMHAGEDLASLIELPRSKVSHTTSLLHQHVPSNHHHAGGDNNNLLDEDADVLATQAFLSMHKATRSGALGYATRSAASMFVPYCLFFILGFAPFATINSLWAQLVVFRNVVPERDQIGTYIGSVYNAANIFPFIYVALNHWREIPERVAIPAVIAVGVAASAVLAFYWTETMHLYTDADGHDVRVSWMIYLATFVSGAVGCLLGVVLYSYTARFRPFATTALSFGMGINGVAIQGLGVLQRIGLVDCVAERRSFDHYWATNPANPNRTTLLMTTALTSATAAMPTTMPVPQTNGTIPFLLVLDKVCFTPDPHYIPMHFDTRDFFLICAAQIALSLLAFFIIDCCPCMMQQHEDPDYFFRQLDKTRAEIEHEQLLAAEAEPDEDERALVDKDGKVKFSLTGDASKTIGSINDSHTADADATAAAGAAGTPAVAVDADGVPKVVQGARSLKHQIFMASLGPVMNQFIKAFYTYFLVPGVTTYLTHNDTVVSGILFSAAISNMVGRIATGCVTIWKLWILNAICMALFVYEFVVAAYVGDFPLPSWILIPVTVIMSGFGGYISTQVYMSANKECLRVFNGDTTHAKTIRQYVSLANQVGSLAGTYLCTAVASSGVFVGQK